MLRMMTEVTSSLLMMDAFSYRDLWINCGDLFLEHAFAWATGHCLTSCCMVACCQPRHRWLEKSQ